MDWSKAAGKDTSMNQTTLGLSVSKQNLTKLPKQISPRLVGVLEGVENICDRFFVPLGQDVSRDDRQDDYVPEDAFHAIDRLLNALDPRAISLRVYRELLQSPNIVFKRIDGGSNGPFQLVIEPMFHVKHGSGHFKGRGSQ